MLIRWCFQIIGVNIIFIIDLYYLFFSTSGLTSAAHLKHEEHYDLPLASYLDHLWNLVTGRQKGVCIWDPKFRENPSDT